MPKCKFCGKGNPFLKLNAEGMCIECQCKPFREMKNSAYVEKIKSRDSAAGSAVCPSCGSPNIRFISEKREAFSAGKAVAGLVVAGGIGATAGFLGGKVGNDVICRDCGHRFLSK